MSPSPLQIVYLAWGRLQRPRANLIQTLHTVNALNEVGVRTRLFLPPWPRRLNIASTLSDFGVSTSLDLRSSRLLHRRWGAWPFLVANQRQLKQTTVYTRVPPISLRMVRLGIVHNLEIHDSERLASNGSLEAICDAHRRGLINLLVPISEPAKQALVTAGADVRRIHIAPSGVDLAAFSSVSPLTPAALSNPRACYIGRVSRDRGLGILEALADRYEIELVGPCVDQPASGITCHPRVNHIDVPRWLERSPIVLMPYQRDLEHAASISPIKLFEAFAAGRCVIASDLPAIRSVVRDGESGLLVDPEDPRAWIDAVERLRADPEGAVQMAEVGRAMAMDFSWQSRAVGIAKSLGLTVAAS